MSPKLNVKDKFNEGAVDLSMSDLSEVPLKEILTLKRVHNLDLSNNSLSILPKMFSSLSSLTVLDLSRNELKELPEDFGNLVKLRHLDLYRNKLQHLPLSFSKLKNLKWLDLKDNPLVPPVAKVAGLCLDIKACQNCAKNIVEFFARLEFQVATELEIRNRDRQKTLEINQKKKREEKKEKKKQREHKITTQSLETRDAAGDALNMKVKVNKIARTKKESSSFIRIILQVLFLIFTVYFAFIYFKVKNSGNVINSAKDLVNQDYIKILDTSQILWKQFKNYIQNVLVYL